MSDILRLELLIPVENDAERCAILQSFFDGSAVEAVKQSALYGQGTSLNTRLYNIECYAGHSYAYLSQLSTYMQNLQYVLENLQNAMNSNPSVAAALAQAASTSTAASAPAKDTKKKKKSSDSESTVETQETKSKDKASSKPKFPKLVGIKRMARS